VFKLSHHARKYIHTHPFIHSHTRAVCSNATIPLAATKVDSGIHFHTWDVMAGPARAAGSCE
jgi:hypothetical protein